MTKYLLHLGFAVALSLVLAGTAWAQSTDWADAYERFIVEIHRAYLVGLHKGVNDTGGYTAVTHWRYLHDMTRRWKSAEAMLMQKFQERNRNDEKSTGACVLKTYVTLMREHSLPCGHSIWTDTGTKDRCFNAISDTGPVGGKHD